MSPLPEVSSRFLLALIWAAVRTTFQTRASSTTPWKKPAATPPEVMAVPRAACWMLVASGVKAPTARVWSRTPSRYRFQLPAP